MLGLLELVENVFRELRQNGGKFRFGGLRAGEDDILLYNILFALAADFGQMFRVV